MAQNDLNRVTVWQAYSLLSGLQEGTSDEIKKKLNILWSLSDGVRVDRVRIWNELARIERLRGNPHLFAVYKLRGLRALGVDRFGDLPAIQEALVEAGYPHEARAAHALYSPPSHSHALITGYIRDSIERCRLYSPIPFEKVIDFRGKALPRVSVVVSMYNAASKLLGFLQRISNQTLITKGELEIILIDSGSPQNEGEVLEHSRPSLPLPVLYARTRERETIQTAWNRGIELARAPYLAFLGVDEAVTPECYEKLALALDEEPSCDWITGDAVVHEVNAEGSPLKQVGWFNRKGYHQSLVSLETGYLSWVGALYRKSIHTRFGFYDGTFRAAGDTEFKSRVLPHLKSKVLPETLGIFLSFPEPRTTESAVAEIEDLRAWYLYRSNAGAEYSLTYRSPSEIEQLFNACLNYRKSYRSEWGTDIEYADALLSFLQSHIPDSSLLKAAPYLREIRRTYQNMEFLERLSESAFDESMKFTQQNALKVRSELRAQGFSAETLGLFTDNRWQQHYWPWTR